MLVPFTTIDGKTVYLTDEEEWQEWTVKKIKLQESKVRALSDKKDKSKYEYELMKLHSMKLDLIRSRERSTIEVYIFFTSSTRFRIYGIHPNGTIESVLITEFFEFKGDLSEIVSHIVRSYLQRERSSSNTCRDSTSGYNGTT